MIYILVAIVGACGFLSFTELIVWIWERAESKPTAKKRCRRVSGSRSEGAIRYEI